MGGRKSASRTTGSQSYKDVAKGLCKVSYQDSPIDDADCLVGKVLARNSQLGDVAMSMSAIDRS